jgi:hypothetical protein
VVIAKFIAIIAIKYFIALRAKGQGSDLPQVNISTTDVVVIFEK